MTNDAAVTVEEANGSRVRARTGPFSVYYDPDDGYVRLCRQGADGGYLGLHPGGTSLRLLAADRVTAVEAETDDETGDGRLRIVSHIGGGKAAFTLRLPADTSGLFSYDLDLSGDWDADIAADWGPELIYHCADGGRRADHLVDYFEGTPGSNPAAGTSDYNQFVYAGDPDVLDATLLYAADWPALDDYFVRTGTNMRGTVSFPPGEVGYEMPAPTDTPGDNPVTVLAATLVLSDGALPADDPQPYCERFVDDIAAVYDRLDRPNTEPVDWLNVSERALDAVEAPANRFEYEEEFHPGGVELVTMMSIVMPYRAYAERFKDEDAAAVAADVSSLVETYYDPDYIDAAGNTGMIGNSPAPLTLTHVDAWYLLWPVIQAAEYALNFDDDRIAEMVVDTADVMVDIGRALEYKFPMWINADSLEGHDPEGGRWNGYQYDCTGAYAYLMCQYHELTGDDRYLTEARAAGDQVLETGFELPYEFTTTPLTPLAMCRLAERTGEERYVGASYVGLANVLRHSYFFDPDYGKFAGRQVFLLSEAMPPDGYEGNFFANALEEWSLLHHLDRYLREGGDALSPSARQMAAELLRHKGTSLADSLAAFQPDPSLVYDGVSPQAGRRVNHEWYLPLEPFGALEPMFEQLGEVGQDLYGVGAYPEMAMLQYHPVGDDATLYVDGPVAVDSDGEFTWRVTPQGTAGTYAARLHGDADVLVDLLVRRVDGGGEAEVDAAYDADADCYRFDLPADGEYILQRRVPKRAVIVEDFTVEPRTVSVNGTATVSMTIRNTSARAGVFDVRCSVGPTTHTESVTLDAHGWVEISFDVSPDEPGTYNVQIAHQDRALSVE